MRTVLLSLCSVSLCISFSFADHNIRRKKDISYLPVHSKGFDKKKHLLDVFYPEHTDTLRDVLIFVHGGSWTSGSKNSYKFLGKNFARNNVVAVNINYRLSPHVQYEEMAFDVARAVRWVKDSIRNYGGNPDRIFISGHSAGGHLAALVTMNSEYFKDAGIRNPLKGAVLIDAFCLDLKDYFTITAPDFAKNYYPVFTSNELNWQAAAPLNYVSRTNLPFVIFTGTKTYPAITIGNERFKGRMDREGKQCEYIKIEGRKHMGMILQMFRRKNVMYNYILFFMKRY